MTVEPSNRSDEWAFRVRDADGVIVGLFRTRERAEAWAAGSVAVPQGQPKQRPFAELIEGAA